MNPQDPDELASLAARAAEQNMKPDTLIMDDGDLKALTLSLYRQADGIEVPMGDVATRFCGLDIVPGSAAWQMFGIVPPKPGTAILIRRDPAGLGGQK